MTCTLLDTLPVNAAALITFSESIVKTNTRATMREKFEKFVLCDIFLSFKSEKRFLKTATRYTNRREEFGNGRAIVVSSS
jgi:hypothetical protein